MKDLILITAFCPTTEKENKLKDIITFIKRYNNLFDIMVSSHSNLSSEIVDMCDYYIYDKENLLLSDDKYRQIMWFQNNNFKIKSNYISSFSTRYTVLKLTSLGVTMANSLGYKKIHKIEYDTNITSMIELIENSNLLEEKDIIFYSKNALLQETMKGAIWSAKINKLPKIYFSFIKDEVLNFLEKNQGKSIESVIQTEFIKVNFFCKNIDVLKNNGIEIDLYNHGFWATPIYDLKENKIKFFTYNNTKKDDINIIVKFSNKVKNIKLNRKNEWNLIHLDYIENINILDVWVDNKRVLNIDFNKINIDNFKKNNNLEYK